MSAPAPSPTPPFVALGDVFTPAELDAVIHLGESLIPKPAPVGGDENAVRGHVRTSQTAWLARSPDSAWLYERMERVVRTLNDRVYQFDLTGFSEAFQYTVYQGAEGGHYDWHVDQGTTQRKLSFTVQLSDPADYAGGDLELHGSNKIETAPRQRGAVIGFPAYVLHRVTPTLSGIRKSLVVWTTGPKFR